MESSEDRKLTGIARSVDALFPQARGSRATTDEMVWEEAVPPRPDASDADPDALRAAVSAFLDSEPLEREGKGRAIREEAGALREANSLDVLADSVERLAREAGDPPDEACVAMAQVLLTPGVSSRIAARLGSARDEKRRAELVRVCQRLGHDMVVALCDALAATNDRFARHTFLDTLVALGDRAMPVVEQMAQDTKWFVVRNAVAILGAIGDARAVELITTTLAHTDSRVRREAILALARVGGEDAGMLVYGMIEDTDPAVRRAAALAAGELKVDRALRPLLALLESESDQDVVVGVLHSLGRLGDPGAVSAIEKRAVTSFFSRPKTEVRIAAYRALHGIGTPRAKGLLALALEDKDPDVRLAVRRLQEG